MKAETIRLLSIDAGAAVIILGGNELAYHYLGRAAVRLTTWLYVLALEAVWVARDLGAIPSWLSPILTGVLIIAFVTSGHGGGGGGGRRRLLSAWKRAKEYLATGVPAPRPQKT